METGYEHPGGEVASVFAARVQALEETALSPHAVRSYPAQRRHAEPDCGLRTRSWDVAYRKLQVMVEGTRLAKQAELRAQEEKFARQDAELAADGIAGRVAGSHPACRPGPGRDHAAAAR